MKTLIRIVISALIGLGANFGLSFTSIDDWTRGYISGWISTLSFFIIMKLQDEL